MGRLPPSETVEPCSCFWGLLAVLAVPSLPLSTWPLLCLCPNFPLFVRKAVPALSPPTTNERDLILATPIGQDPVCKDSWVLRLQVLVGLEARRSPHPTVYNINRRHS